MLRQTLDSESQATSLWGLLVRGKWWMAAFAALGLLLIAVGVQKWSTRRGPTATIAALVAAIRVGNHAEALRLLAPQNRASPGQLGRAASDWVPSPGLQSELHRLDVYDDLATAELWLSEQGCTVKPQILLRRQPDGSWKIAEIANLRIDPRWVEAEQRRLARDDERLAEELEAAVRNLPGVLVERETASDVRRR